MLNVNKFHFFGFLISSCLYVSILFLIEQQLSIRNDILKKFTSKKNNLIEVVMVESKSNAENKKQTTRTLNKKNEMDPNKQPQKKANIENLFSKIDTKALPVEQKNVNNNLQTKNNYNESKSTFNQKSASTIVKNLNIKKQSDLNLSSSSSNPYDEFIGKISDILNENWQNYMYMSQVGPEAHVRIYISSFGNFEYKITSLSYNETFNEILKEFLNEMSFLEFPHHNNKSKVEFTTIFKIDGVIK